jgi:hypothetical protein
VVRASLLDSGNTCRIVESKIKNEKQLKIKTLPAMERRLREIRAHRRFLLRRLNIQIINVLSCSNLPSPSSPGSPKEAG